MVKCNSEFAIEKALELAEKYIESTGAWVCPENVTDFIETVYDFLVGDAISEE